MTNILNIEYLPLAALQPYERNTKMHPDWQVQQIVNSIKQFGMNDPIAIDEATSVIIEGHGRLLACKELGFTEVPVIKLGHLNSVEQRAYRIAHNKLSMNTGFDIEILQEEMLVLQEEGFNLELTGFDKTELAEMDIGGPEDENDNDPDETPDITVQGEPVIKKGDIVELGRHRLLCGDCTIKENYDALMQGKTADMVFTDPPYNVNYNYNSYKDDKESWEYKEFCISFINCITQQTTRIIITPGKMNLRLWYEIFEVDDSAVWIKNNAQSGSKIAKIAQTEPILFKGKFEHNRMNDIFTYYVLSGFLNGTGESPVNKGEHTCPKPIGLIQDICESYSDKNDLILDPFLGSGTTIIACEKTNRTCYGMEIDPQYCDVIVERYCKYVNNYNIKINSIPTDWQKAKQTQIAMSAAS